MVRRLILIKHSVPEIEPSLPAAQWHLSRRGQSLCHLLAKELEGLALAAVVTSKEPKARETGAILSQLLHCPSMEADGLHEHDRGNVGLLSQTEFRSLVAEALRRPKELVFGLETADQANSRFSSAVDRILTDIPHGDVAIVAHGTVISLLVSHRCGVDALRLWESLGLPSFVEVAVPDFDLVRVRSSIC